MNRMSRYFMALAFAAVLSAGVSVPSLAAVKITKNTADWVLEAEQKRAEQEAQEEAAAAEAAAAAEEAASAEAQEEAIRAQVVDYALSFVGGRYVYGGNDPHSGVDCSGFTRYVLGNAAGVALGRSSRDQAAEGTTVSAEQMQPGDLLFYGSGSHVNHVAMYIGNGQIVHASTERTGIKVSSWNYRAPLRIASFLG
ncbi:cell wall-associated NlpC family hydrolase [Fusobacterium naviforme]|nr:NlpC/P60 family protein [Fusobacterium naviforme]PSL11453.1 cell wall-associated NlpC family hydrolase [Fusobacterium naviforme]STO26535.1 Probable endopeptidase p60 precursor [Fusobacterium naviforme]